MGTKTADETGAETGPEVKTDEEKVDVTKSDAVGADEVTEADSELGTDSGTEADDAEDGDEAEVLEGLAEDEKEGPSGVGQGAAAVVSVGLGLVSLTGGWIGTVAAARETLVGQLETASTATVATQVKEIYGDAWQTSALWAGFFALAALVVGVFVLARPAFGAPGKPQAPWIKSVGWAGVALGVIGLLLAVLKYTDVLLGLPSTS
ncbi:hypothetical protein HLK59_24560 [Streptomyces sp. S3(2020)]|uniref:hypothetical protein n=1 Tax=Streptomyces sp. S3(2020) TaxID=2732044 RepID=UPI001489E319|nr:hypothetical protein [Streptomyces sp. S3(2020)]NNN33473.1 hypothetical protein [Streptomyces sp. S3(2020)]